MKKRKVIKTVVWCTCVLVVLLLTLVIHIAMVSKPKNLDNNTLQLSRIDFKQELDSAEAQKIRHYACSLPGVKNAVINLNQKTLVVGYLNTVQTADKLFKQIIEYGNYQAVKFVPVESAQNSGCPAGYDTNSFSNKISSLINKWFN